MWSYVCHETTDTGVKSQHAKNDGAEEWKESEKTLETPTSGLHL